MLAPPESDEFQTLNPKFSIRGWPARFRKELELLKGAMAEYEESQLNALSALGAEKEKSKQLADEVSKPSTLNPEP